MIKSDYKRPFKIIKPELDCCQKPGKTCAGSGGGSGQRGGGGNKEEKVGGAGRLETPEGIKSAHVKFEAGIPSSQKGRILP